MRYRSISIALLFLLGFLHVPIASAQQAVYLIRHAEQVHDVEDPLLTGAGQERAKMWANILRDAGIDVVYTSKKNRTRETEQLITESLKVPVEVMSRKDVQGLVDRVRTKPPDNAVLIVSHSRTIPKLVKAFGSSDDATINRDDYDNLFVIVPKGEEGVTVVRLRYK